MNKPFVVFTLLILLGGAHLLMSKVFAQGNTRIGTTFNESGNHIWSTSAPLILNGTGYNSSQLGNNTLINPNRGSVGIGTGNSSIFPLFKCVIRSRTLSLRVENTSRSGGTAIQAIANNNNAYLFNGFAESGLFNSFYVKGNGDLMAKGQAGIGTSPSANIQLHIKREGGCGLCVEQTAKNSWPYAVRAIVSQDNTKGFGVRHTVRNQETFTVMGNGNIISRGQMSLGSPLHHSTQLHVTSSKNVGLCIDHSHATANGYALKVVVNPNSTKAFAIIQEGQPDTDVFRVMSDGFVFARELMIRELPFPDYVFEEDYELNSYEELGSFIEKNKHLPNIPGQNELSDGQVKVGEMQRLQLEKIEELTLYILDLNKRLEQVEAENKLLKASLSE